MVNYLKASAKAVRVFAGPLAAPFEGVLSLYEDEQTEKRQAELDAMINEVQNVSRETLGEIFEARTDIKELREQFILGMEICFSILAQNRKLLSSRDLEENLVVLIESDREKLEARGFITKEVLTKEISKIYADSPKLFQTTIGMAGFPLELIPQGDELKVIVFKFINRCVNLQINQQIKIFKSLSEENPDSDILRIQTQILKEKALNRIGE